MTLIEDSLNELRSIADDDEQIALAQSLHIKKEKSKFHLKVNTVQDNINSGRQLVLKTRTEDVSEFQDVFLLEEKLERLDNELCKIVQHWETRIGPKKINDAAASFKEDYKLV